MSFRFLFPVLTYPDATPTISFPRALDLAATLGGDVHAIVVEIDIPPIVNPIPLMGFDVAAMAAEAEERSRAVGKEIVAELQHQAKHISLPLTVEKMRARREFVGGLMATKARTHDLTLICLADSDDHRELGEAILFQSGGPVVLFPHVEAPMHLGTVAVAWDGGRAAARALRDALPLLAFADRVLILTAEADKRIDPQSVEQVIELLAHHEIDAIHIEALMVSRLSIGEALQEAALQQGAGLMVMGAYGHGRLREFVLGGATRSILASRRLPVLMSH